MFRAIVASAIILTAACSQQAFAAAACSDAKEIVAYLAEKYGEQEAITMISMRGPSLTIYANPETGSFTVIATMATQPDIACVIDTGTDFTILPIGNPA
jgi:hypothetical protein